MKINLIEDVLVAHLKTAVADKFRVESFPADLQRYLESFIHQNGALLVQYVSTKRTFTSRNSGTKRMTFEISAVSKNLKSEKAHQGIYAMLDAAFDNVSGVTFTDVGIAGLTLFAVSDEYQTYYIKNGLWVYTQTYESDDIPFIKDIVEAAPLLKKITLTESRQDELHDTFIVESDIP